MKELQVHENKQAIAYNRQTIRISIFDQFEQWKNPVVNRL
jgi:hypothetical protein